MLASRIDPRFEDERIGDGEALISPFGAATLEVSPARSGGAGQMEEAIMPRIGWGAQQCGLT